MIQYSPTQQVLFFSKCNTATSLLETRNQLECIQNMSSIALIWYNLQMSLLLQENRI